MAGVVAFATFCEHTYQAGSDPTVYESILAARLEHTSIATTVQGDVMEEDEDVKVWERPDVSNLVRVDAHRLLSTMVHRSHPERGSRN